MQVRVKSTKVLKTGTNDYGDWKLVQVTTVEDVKYTTLAKEAETITPDSIINITDLDKDKKERESFKKFEVIEQASKSTTRPQIETNGKNRAFALSYAKDIAVAKIMMGGEMTPTHILTTATLFESYLDNGATVEKKED